jgi:hypothetical protein
VAFVDEDQRVVGDIFEERRRRLAGAAAGEVARIVLDARAGAGGLQHLDVIARALLEALGFQQAAGLFQLGEAELQLLLDRLDGAVQRRARGDIVAVGVDLDRLQVAGLLAGQRVELGDRVDLVAEHGDAPGRVFKVGREDFDRVAAHPETAALKIHLAALVLLGDEVGEQLALVEPFADLHLEGHRRIGLDRADTVDAGDRGDDDAVVALDQRAGGRVAHAVDLLVDRGFLLDERIGARHISFRLVIIVVGDEIFDRVFREEVLELGIELGGQRLVRREDDRGALRRLDHLGHGEGFARAGDAEQHLAALARRQALDEVLDGGRLVAGGLVFADHADRDAALRLFRPGGAVRRPELAVLEQRIAGFDEGRKRFNRGSDGRAGIERDGVFQRGVHAGDRIEAGGGAGFGVGRTADRDAAGGFGDRDVFRVAARGVLHRLAVFSGLGGDLAAALDARGFRFGLELLHPIGDAARKGLSLERRLGGFLETGVRGGGFLRGSGHAGNMERVIRKEKRG